MNILKKNYNHDDAQEAVFTLPHPHKLTRVEAEKLHTS